MHADERTGHGDGTSMCMDMAKIVGVQVCRGSESRMTLYMSRGIQSTQMTPDMSLWQPRIHAVSAKCVYYSKPLKAALPEGSFQLRVEVWA